jgi:hypothetical protein
MYLSGIVDSARLRFVSTPFAVRKILYGVIGGESYETSEKLFLNCHSDSAVLWREKNLFVQFEKKNQILRLPTENVGTLRMTLPGNFSRSLYISMAYRYTANTFNTCQAM